MSGFLFLFYGLELELFLQYLLYFGRCFPILVYTIDGVKRTDKVLFESTQTLGNDRNIIKRVILPSIPYVVSGLELGVGIVLMCTISTEIIGSSSGLGYMILTATNLFDPGTTVVGILIIFLIGFFLIMYLDLYKKGFSDKCFECQLKLKILIKPLIEEEKIICFSGY